MECGTKGLSLQDFEQGVETLAASISQDAS
jgi:hypothetical protein